MNPKKSSYLILAIMMFSGVNFVDVHSQSVNSFYVSPDGDNSNDGSLRSPWRTIEFGINEINSGDFLYIREGVYYEKLYFTKSGSQQNYLTIRNFPGESPIIDGGQNVGNGLVVSSSYFKLIGLEIRNWSENGIWVESSQYFEIINCTISDVLGGIGISDGSHDFIVKNCQMSDFTLYGFDTTPVSGRDCYNAIIQDCVAYSGSDQDQNVDGFAVGHGDQKKFSFINCVSYDVYDGFDISSDDTLLLGCKAFNCWNSGYKLWGDNITLINCLGYDSNTNLELDWSGTPKTVYIYHSDFVQADIFNIWVENKRDTICIYNSVIACGENIGICFENGYASSYIGDYNLIHNLNQDRFVSFSYEKEYNLQAFLDKTWNTDTGQDLHSIFVENIDGIFMDPNEMNFYPQPDSVLINTGDATNSVKFDIDYSPRPEYESPDIGAYEFNPDGKPDEIPDFELPKVEMDEQIIDEDDEIFRDDNTLYYWILLLAIICIIPFLTLQKRL